MGIPRKSDLKGLSGHLIVGGPVPPVLEAHDQNLGLSAMCPGSGTVVGSLRSGGRLTLMLHLFLNSQCPAAAPPPPSRLSGHCFSRAREPEDKACAVRGMPGEDPGKDAQARMHQHKHKQGCTSRSRLRSTKSRDASEKSLALTTLDELSGRK